MKNDHVKLFITGGHMTPALAVISEIQKTHPGWRIVFVGRKYAMEGDRHVSAEFESVSGLGVRFLPITTGRIQRAFSAHTIPSLVKIPIGFIQSFIYIIRERPDVILSFGGYIAIPVAVVGALCGIPVITHEQTRMPGFSNKLIAKFARIICVTFADTASQFPPNKTVVTGLPIRQELFLPPKTNTMNISLKKQPLIYITGGSTGATSLNNKIFPIIPDLIKHAVIIHQTGVHSLEEAKRVWEMLSSADKDRYHVATYFESQDVSWILHHCTIIISRAGANTVMELAALGKVALLVPLPWSAANEQQHNAEWLKNHAGAEIIDQNSSTSKDIQRQCIYMLKNSSYQHQATELATHVPRDGASRVIAEIESL